MNKIASKMAILIKIALCAQYALKMQSRIRSHWSTHSLKTPFSIGVYVGYVQVSVLAVELPSNDIKRFGSLRDTHKKDTVHLLSSFSYFAISKLSNNTKHAQFRLCMSLW